MTKIRSYKNKINLSLVIYKTGMDDVQYFLDLVASEECIKTLYIVDNYGDNTISNFIAAMSKVELISGHGNVGYGAGHNLAIRESIKDFVGFHLVVNPDVRFDVSVLETLRSYCQKLDSGILIPSVVNEKGERQTAGKLCPAPFDLLIRILLPSRFFSKARSNFNLKQYYDLPYYTAPYISGCFMFLCIKKIEDIGMFDEQFFMYPEDIDLSRRFQKKYKNFVINELEIIHRHEAASKKNLRMLLIHITNVAKYFFKWGWFLDKERQDINIEAAQINYQIRIQKGQEK